MGRKNGVWAYFESTGGEGFYAYADVYWNSSYEVTISNISYSSEASASNFKWRVGARGNTGKALAGTDLGPKYTFQGSENGQYIFQACTRESASGWGGTWDSGGFTLTDDDSGGGGGGGGGGGTPEYVDINYDKNGYTWKSFPDNVRIAYGASITIPSATPPDKTSTSEGFTIIGDANGGTFPSGAITKLDSEKTTTKTYSFDDWRDQYTTWFFVDEVVPIYENSTFFAQQIIKESKSYSNNDVSALTKPNPPASTSAALTATFDANGGTVDPKSQSVDTTVAKTFGGWMDSNGTVITSLESEGTVKAKWDDSYSDVTVTLPRPDRDGYRFIGWSTSTLGTNLQQPGDQVSISENTTFYAFWTEKETPKSGVFIHDGTKWQLVSS